MKYQPNTLLLGTCLTVAGMLLSGRAMAQDEELQDGGSQAWVNLGGDDVNNIGMYNWQVGTDNQMQNELDQQWFWYSVNGGAVQSIDQIGGETIYSSTGNYLDVEYANSQIGIEVTYQLTGSGFNSGTADIMEDLYVYNLSDTLFNVNVFEYSNFNLLGNGENSVQVYPDGANGYDEAYQSEGSSAVAEGIVNPDAANAEAGLAGAVLNDVKAGTLNGNSQQDANDDVTLTAGPGNVAWAFEWSTALDSGDTYTVLKDKELSVTTIPEPSSIALIGLGLGVVGWLRRRQS